MERRHGCREHRWGGHGIGGVKAREERQDNKAGIRDEQLSWSVLQNTTFQESAGAGHPQKGLSSSLGVWILVIQIAAKTMTLTLTLNHCIWYFPATYYISKAGKRRRERSIHQS